MRAFGRCAAAGPKPLVLLPGCGSLQQLVLGGKRSATAAPQSAQAQAQARGVGSEVVVLVPNDALKAEVRGRVWVHVHAHAHEYGYMCRCVRAPGMFVRVCVEGRGGCVNCECAQLLLPCASGPGGPAP